MLGKPRRFSGKFIYQERQKLSKFRNKKRKSQSQSLLRVGQQILCKHPICSHYHQANILTMNMNESDKLLVKFYENELGSQSVKDYQIYVYQLDNINLFMNEQEDGFNYELVFNNQSKEENENMQIVLQDIDYNAMAAMFMLLDRKAKLISFIKQYNNNYEVMIKNRQQNEIDLANNIGISDI